jgi:hypothetical protein
MTNSHAILLEGPAENRPLLRWTYTEMGFRVEGMQVQLKFTVNRLGRHAGGIQL